MMRSLFPLLLLLASACAHTGRREPVPVRAGDPLPTTPRRTVAAPPAADPRELDAATEALLERLLVETPSAAAEEPLPVEMGAPTGPPDERPLALLVDWELGPGPFTIAEREVPPSALRYTLSVALERRFQAGGALRGPRRVEPPELDLSDAASFAEPLPAELLAAGRELGARYLLHGRLERMEQRAATEALERGRRQLSTERAWLVFSYELYELDSGARVCAAPIERSFELGRLSPDELASAEWLLAWELARLVREDVARCLAAASSAARGE